MKKEKNPLEIDLFNLHEECRKQSKLYKRWSDRHANAVKVQGEAKSAMELSFADLMLKINRRPSKYGLDKKTGPLLESAIIVQPEYQEATQAYHDAKHAADTLKGMVEACDERKKMLELEIQLWIGAYFASPRTEGREKKGPKRE